MKMFVYGTLREGTHYYEELVKPYIEEEKTEEGTLAFTNVGGGAIFRHGGVNELPGYYYELNMASDLAEMWKGLNEHESSPQHFRRILIGDDLIVYEWNFESRGYTEDDVMVKAADEYALRQEFMKGAKNGSAVS